MSKNKEEDVKEKPKPVVARSIVDVQRLKLEKLMKNPDKLVIIPEKPKERGVPTVPDFVRNVMGSSAGAGSGEFHVYRHLRRKEYARQHYMTEKAKWEKMEDAYHDKLEENKRKADDQTAKKRAKRIKKKHAKKKGGNKKLKSPSPSSSESENEEETGEDNELTEDKMENVASNTVKIDDENTDVKIKPVEDKDEKIIDIKAVQDKKNYMDDTNDIDVKIKKVEDVIHNTEVEKCEKVLDINKEDKTVENNDEKINLLVVIENNDVKTSEEITEN